MEPKQEKILDGGISEASDGISVEEAERISIEERGRISTEESGRISEEMVEIWKDDTESSDIVSIGSNLGGDSSSEFGSRTQVLDGPSVGVNVEMTNGREDDAGVALEKDLDECIHSLSSIGSAGTIIAENDDKSDAESEQQDTLGPNDLIKMKRNSVSTTQLPQQLSGSSRSVFTSIVLMPEQGKWDQLAQRDKMLKFCVIPVLEDQVGPKMQPTDDLDEVGESGDSADSTLESTSPLRQLLARRAMAITRSTSNPVAEMPFGSAVDINRSLRDVRRAKGFGQVLPDKNKLKKNFLLQCLSFFFVFTGYIPVRGLQTSLNHHQNLGAISVSVIYAWCVIGSICCPILVQRYGAKRTLCVSITAFLVYIAGNVYPSFYTLIPSSCIVGIGFATLLGAQGAYQTNVAAAYSTVTQTKIEKVLPFFGGIYFTFAQTGNIVGNALSSTVLKILGPMIDPEFYLLNQQEVHNESNITPACGASFCNEFEEGVKFHVSEKAFYTLIGILFCFVIISMIICTFFVDRLDAIFKRRDKSLKSHLKTVFSYHRDGKTWLLLFLATYTSFCPAFVYGDLVKAFVTCPVGLDMIGYAIVCYASANAIMAFSSGLVSKIIGIDTLQYVGFVGSAGLSITMLLWEPDRDRHYLIFILFCCLGLVHAIYSTRSFSLIGTIFAGKTETAFSFFLMYQSVVAASVFALSPLTCMRVKLYCGAAYEGLTFIAYTLLVLKLRREKLQAKEIADV